MEAKTPLENAIGELNHLLGDVTPYKLAIAAPGDLQPLDKNAHYMSKRVYDQLTDNISRDGNLSSLPFCWRSAAGGLETLSGNHRVETAKRAGVERILVLYTDAELSKGERVAIQLSHNSLVGQDNPVILRELWNEIDDLKLKVYSGLDDNLLKTMEDITIIRIQEARLRFEELVLYFVSSEIDRIETVLEQLGAVTKRRFAARVEDFDTFFEMLLDFKEASGIMSTSTAFLAMIEIVTEWLERNVVEHGENDE